MRSIKAFKKSIATAFCCLGLFGTGVAQADVPVFETTNTTTAGSFVANAYGFNITTPGLYYGTLTDLANPKAFEFLSLNILQGFTTTGPSLGGTSGAGKFSFMADTAGLYTALLFGVPGSGSGTGSFSISVVPEVETWVMLLIGMGLIAYQLRRKNKLESPTMNMSIA